MHLVQEIMIMEMNLMTLCENDCDNQVQTLKNMKLAQQCSNAVNTELDVNSFHFGQHFCNVISDVRLIIPCRNCHA